MKTKVSDVTNKDKQIQELTEKLQRLKAAIRDSE